MNSRLGFFDPVLKAIARLRAGKHLDFVPVESLRNVKGLNRSKVKGLHRRLVAAAELLQLDAECNRDLHYSLGYRDGLLDAADEVAAACEHKSTSDSGSFTLDVPDWVNRNHDAA